MLHQNLTSLQIEDEYDDDRSRDSTCYFCTSCEQVGTDPIQPDWIFEDVLPDIDNIPTDLEGNYCLNDTIEWKHVSRRSWGQLCLFYYSLLLLVSILLRSMGINQKTRPRLSHCLSMLGM